MYSQCFLRVPIIDVDVHSSSCAFVIQYGHEETQTSSSFCNLDYVYTVLLKKNSGYLAKLKKTLYHPNIN